MAKKKLTHEKQPQNQDNSTHKLSKTNAAKPIEEPSEKFQNLKSLNSLLLKEAFDRRLQIDSLMHAKGVVEAELTRSVIENKSMGTDMSEQTVEMELEKGVLFAFMETQMRQMDIQLDGLVRENVEIEKLKRGREDDIESLKQKVDELSSYLRNESAELRRVGQERNLLKKDCDKVRRDFDKALQEANGLRSKLGEMEKGESFLKEEIEKLKVECERLVKENIEKERVFEAVIREKDFDQIKIVDLEKMVGSLKGEVEGVLKEKNEIEMEKNALEVKAKKSDKDMEQLNKIVMELETGTKTLQDKNLELEEYIFQSTRDMETEIKSLVGEKRENEQSIKMLEVERDEVKKLLEVITWEKDDKHLRIEKLIQEKNEIEEAKVSQEIRIVELDNEVNELRDMVFTLRNSYSDQQKKNMELHAEVGYNKEAFESISRERNETQNAFHEEQKKVEKLNLVVSEKEKRIEEIVKELHNMKSERESLIEKSKVTENHLETLLMENDTAQKNIFELQRKIEDWKTKFELVGMNSERVLGMLKQTAILFSSQSEDKNIREVEIINERKLDEEIQPHVAEMDAIRIAFRNKEKIVEEMKEQIELLQHSAGEAQKKKNFWTLVSSAVTIVAAASFAYAAKAR